MPISGDEWDSGKTRPLEERIMSFLNRKGNENYAFSIQEIIRGLGYKVKTTEPSYFGLLFNAKKTLDNLIKDGKVEEKKVTGVSGEDFYYRTVKSVHLG
jgi:hypothetical protein